MRPDAESINLDFATNLGVLFSCNALCQDGELFPFPENQSPCQHRYRWISSAVFGAGSNALPVQDSCNVTGMA